MSGLSWFILLLGALVCAEGAWKVGIIFRRVGPRHWAPWFALACLIGMFWICGYLFGETLK